MSQIAENLKKIRKLFKKTQPEFADMMEVSVYVCIGVADQRRMAAKRYIY